MDGYFNFSNDETTKEIWQWHHFCLIFVSFHANYVTPHFRLLIPEMEQCLLSLTTKLSSFSLHAYLKIFPLQNEYTFIVKRNNKTKKTPKILVLY